MKKYLIIAAIFLAVGLLLAGGKAIEYAIDKAAKAEAAAQQAVQANVVTKHTLEYTTNATSKMVAVTGKLAEQVQTLASTTKKGMTSLQKGLADAKTIDLTAAVPADVSTALCVQWAESSGYAGGMAGKAVSSPLVQNTTHALAGQCRAAWANVTWRDLVEYVVPLMEYGGQTRMQLEAGAAYYGPKVGTHMGKGQE
ncbi:hypothetical protein [Desulfovibrio cuneatus]|uniref:hypothetical protein n=1 Tax=Desulfovibrio cuneatus TaxID=159728 RepID=UPI0004134DC6|nr:hypothetical protein [Desulfovibrio cuneatus]